MNLQGKETEEVFSMDNSKNFKVLFITNSYSNVNNGPALFSNLIFDGFQKIKQIDFRILTEDISNEKLKQCIYKLPIQINFFNKLFYQFIRILKYHIEAQRLKKEFDYDVLIYNNAFTGLLSTFFSKCPVIVMLNDYARLDKLNSKFRISKSYFKNLVLFHLEKQAVKHANLTIVNSSFMKKLVQNMYLVKPDNIGILIKGIELSNYSYIKEKVFSNNIEILFVKADFRVGGLFDLVKAILNIKQYNIRLTIVGPPEYEHRFIIKTLDQLEFSNYTLHGVVGQPVIRKLMQNASIFCVPSHKEALGVANMEALASGLPVISTNVGGIPEVLDNGKCGWLVEKGDIKGLAKAIQECIENKNKRNEYSMYGYNFVQKFDSKDLVNRFVQIVNSVI